MGSFEILEHTGEIGVVGHGKSLANAFGQVARGMFSFMVELGTVEERVWRQVKVEASDQEALLVDWLNELIYLFDTEGIVFSSFHVEEVSGFRLTANCSGERLDPEKHRFAIAPKAAIYHMAEVKEVPNGAGWRAQVILDI